jgi:flagellar biogenesis protein FliO
MKFLMSLLTLVVLSGTVLAGTSPLKKNIKNYKTGMSVSGTASFKASSAVKSKTYYRKKVLRKNTNNAVEISSKRSVSAQKASNGTAFKKVFQASREKAIILSDTLPMMLISSVPSSLLANMTETNTSAGESLGLFSYTEPLTQNKENSIFPTLLRVILSLLLIVGVIYLLVFLFKKSILQKRVAGKNNMLNILDRSYIDAKRFICLAEVAGRIIVLGVTDSQIQLLSEINDEQMVRFIKEQNLQKNIKPGSSFIDYLQGFSATFGGMFKESKG